MGTVDKQGLMTMEELLVSSLAQSDALTNLLIDKGLITEAEFMGEGQEGTGFSLAKLGSLLTVSSNCAYCHVVTGSCTDRTNCCL